jgi:hypothetical protein
MRIRCRYRFEVLTCATARRDVPTPGSGDIDAFVDLPVNGTVTVTGRMRKAPPARSSTSPP